MKIAITGVGGFIGARLTERALARNDEVSGVDRDPAAVGRAQKLGAAAVVADVTADGEVMADAFHGADVVIHTAAIVAEGGDIELFRNVNVGGTETTMRAAQAADVPAFVHLSSVMVHGFTFPDGITETGPRRGDGSPYCITKIEGEDLVRSFDRDGFRTMVVRPGDVYGPGSIPWVVRPCELMNARRFALPEMGRGVFNHVYIDNLIDGILLAVDQGAYGETFTFTDGRSTTCKEYFSRLAMATGAPKPPSLPTAPLRWAVKLTGMDPDGLRFLMRTGAYSIEKARSVLGYEPAVDLDEGMRRVSLNY